MTRKKLTPPEIRRLLVEAGSALGYAAQRGIVHRDIKPDNIMFDEFGQSVLTDFGIAKAASGQKLTGTGMSIGTPHYMSPEQARAQAIDGRSDIYSLGVVAYQCLTGTVPYDGEDSFSIGYKHITEPIPTPSLVTADERRIFEVIKRMLMKDPFDRFQSCEELVASFRGQPIAAPGAVRASVATFVGSAAAVAGAACRRRRRRWAASDRQPAHDAAGLAAGQPASSLRGAARVPRRVADRSVAMRTERVLLGLALGAARGARWSRWRASTTTKPEASRRGRRRHHRIRRTGRRFAAGRYSSGKPDAARSGDPAPAPAVRPPTVSRDSAPPAARRRRSRSRSPRRNRPGGQRRASGSSDLPRGSTVMIDEKPVTQASTRLPPGPHALAISAPRYNFYSDTIVVRPGQVAGAHSSAHADRRAGTRPTRRDAAASTPDALPGTGLQRATAPASTSAPSR